jgi:hypothetical protein
MCEGHREDIDEEEADCDIDEESRSHQFRKPNPGNEIDIYG